MILFNLIYFKDAWNSPSHLIGSTLSVENRKEKSFLSAKNQANLAYIFKKPEVLSETQSQLAQKKFVNKNVRQKVLYTLWGQELFLSLNSKFLKKYNADLNSYNINKSQNNQKSLVSKFSRALFDGSIKATLSKEDCYSKTDLLSIEYLWSKSIKQQFSKVNNWFQESLSNTYVKNLQDRLGNNLNLNYLPIFTISNHLGQMIISEPPTDLNDINYVQPYKSVKSYNSNFYHGFFFINYKDAEEYMHYIQKYYNLEPKNLRIFTCNFKIFYKIMRKLDNSVSFRLIPDLKEVSDLIKKYRYYKKVSFHKKQIYGRSYFQGQPLYLIQGSKINFSKNISQGVSQSYNLIFLNYDDALKTFYQLNNQKLEAKVKNLKLIVYNLESFIQDCMNIEDHEATPHLVLPSKESYLFTKTYELKKRSNLFLSTSLDTIASANLWLKRVFWSLTSRKP